MQAVPEVNPLPEYRELPCNLEAEQAVLGAILTNNEAMNLIGDFLTSDHFYEPVHKRIFESIHRFNDRGLKATPVTLKNIFDSDEALSEIGGAVYLAKIAGMASGIIDVRDHASIVYSLAISRNLIEIGEEMVNDAYDSNGELRASEQIEKSEHRLFTLASDGSSDTSFSILNKSVTNAIKMAEAASKQGAIDGVKTNFKDLDAVLGGLHNSDLVILAARPSMGKTALAVNLAMNAAEEFMKEFREKKGTDNEMKEPKSVGVISLEMSSEQLAVRLLSMETGINASNIRRGKLSTSNGSDDFQNLVDASRRLHELPLFIDDTPALTISAVRTRARRMKRRHNLSLLVVDYLQLLRGVSKHSHDSRVQEISEITMGLKAIAKELNIPVLALSQLSRAVENRENKRPQLSDLRESGTIEQDSDVVMFIYREAYYLERSKPTDPIEGSETYDDDMRAFEEWYKKHGEFYESIKNRTEIIISKHRNGPIGNVPLIFNSSTTRFRSITYAG